MGKHVDRCSQKLEAKGFKAHKVDAGPFGGVFEPNIEVENRSVYELLRSDCRVERILADSLVMTLLRTGMDSVSNPDFRLTSYILLILFRLGTA